MRSLFLAVLIATAAASAMAQPAGKGRGGANLCDVCGTVQDVRQEKQKGEGGVAGVAGGAVVGGLLGNQVGGGTGKTLATVGGAVAGGFLGNEVQKRVTSKTVWITTVRMKNGSVQTFQQEAQPGWSAGQVVQVHGTTLKPR